MYEKPIQSVIKELSILVVQLGVVFDVLRYMDMLQGTPISLF